MPILPRRASRGPEPCPANSRACLALGLLTGVFAASQPGCAAWAQTSPLAVGSSPAFQGAPLPVNPEGSRVPGRGVAALLDQAHYWSSHGRPQLAHQSLARLLMVEPNNPEVLATAAEVAAVTDDRAAAEMYVARLAVVAPGTPAQARGIAALRIAHVDQAALAEARRLAQAGQPEAAMKRYRETFPEGAVPDIYAIEYFQTLAGVSAEGFREAREGMGALVARNPRNATLRLTYAEMLTYREETRPEGLDLLRDLSALPETAGAARMAWRQTLLWQGAGTEAFEMIEDYLKVFPPDPELTRLMEDSRPLLGDRMSPLRVLAFGMLESDPAGAEAIFQRALRENEADVDALLGLGMIRRRQQRAAEAREIFERLKKLAPDRRANFEQAMGYAMPDGRPVPEGGMVGARGHARGASASRAAPAGTGPGDRARIAIGLGWNALQRGKLEDTQAQAQAAAQGGVAEQAEAANLLGQVALRRRDLSTAELRFREALSRRPQLPGVQSALYDVLVQQGRLDDAGRFAAETGFRPPGGTQALRAAALREQAARTPDAERRIALLRSACAADPGDVWAAQDLARLLKTRGQQEEPRRIERDLAARGTTDALYAAALLSEFDGRVADTVARLEAIPAAARNPSMAVMLERSRRTLELRRLEVAARGRPRSVEAQRLVALAGQPDPSGEIRAAVIRAFGRLGQAGNLEAAERAAASGASVAGAKAALAAALLDAGRAEEARRLAGEAGADPRLVADLRRSAESARGTLPRADTYAASGEAESWRAQLSLARVYARSGREEDAAAVAEGVLRGNPDNVEARSVAGEVAVLRGRMPQAETLLSEGRSRGADRLQMALLEARIARARQDQPRARRALETAARLRGEQLQAAAP